MNLKEGFIFVRYIILVAIGLLLPWLYKLFTFLTLCPVYFLLSIFYEVSVINNTLIFSGVSIEIVNACVAGAAYYLLLILNLSTKMNYKQRIYSVLFSVFLLLCFNILRIFLLAILFEKDFAYLQFVHVFLWLFVSIIFIVFIWFLSVKLFKIKNIPVYSDIIYLIKKIKKKDY